jgi:hypothetical protein
MANIKKSATDRKAKQYMILPRNQETYKEKFAVVGRKKLPFETPVTLTMAEVKTIEHQKEPFQEDKELTVYEVMEKYQVDQKKAAEIVQAQALHPEIGGKSIKWRSKYLLQAC